MQIIISPAKTLDFVSEPKFADFTTPAFLEDSCQLMDELKQLGPDDLSSLMKISEKLGELNYDRNQNWQTPFTPKNSKQCIYAFKGDVYTGLDAESLNKKDIQFAQKHLRVLSGLYGLLKPLDLIQAYRLEMGTRFTNHRGTNLYEFWGNKLTEAINNEFDKNSVLINLASNEYSKALKTKNIEAEIITPVFKDNKNGTYKLISFYAKKARGLMSRFIIENKIKDPEKIKNFNVEGYQFNSSLSKDNDWVFTRDQIAA
ncbi:MAG: peroxide stress protein YaaA [Gammaproteobacteria bacterium]